MSKFVFKGNNTGDGIEFDSKDPIDKKILGISIGVAILVVVSIGITIFFMLNSNNNDAFGDNENQEIVRQKQELTELYSHSEIALQDEDFKVTRDDNGDIVVEVVPEKQAQLSAAKDAAIDDIFKKRTQQPSDNPTPDGSEDKPAQDEQPEDNTADNKIDEAMILEAINSQNSNISNFFSRSLDSSNGFYGDALSILLQSARTGNPSMDDWYDCHPGYSNREAFSCLCGYVYTFCCEVPDDTAIWTNSYLFNYSGDVLYNCIINENYNLSFSSIESIYEEVNSFDLCGDQIDSAYVVYSNGHYIYLTYEFEVLDII